MRSRVALITFAIAASVLAVPLIAQAASIPFFGPIVGDTFDPKCALGWGALILVINNIIRLLLTIAIVFVAPLMIAYAGFLLVVNPVHPEGKTRAKSLLLNLAIGLVIALSAWLIVDLIMATLYNDEFGTWSEIITTGGEPACLTFPTELAPAPTPGGVVVAPGARVPDTSFDYRAGIEKQKPHASAALNTLLSCMVSKVPGNVGEISSISDILITSDEETFSTCASGECQHAKNSCHYGGTTCVGKSYAVDFGDEQNTSILAAAAQACGADFVNLETDHLHVSVGAACGCDDGSN